MSQRQNLLVDPAKEGFSLLEAQQAKSIGNQYLNGQIRPGLDPQSSLRTIVKRWSSAAHVTWGVLSPVCQENKASLEGQHCVMLCFWESRESCPSPTK